MAITVHNGSSDYFTALAYGTPDPLTMTWCNQRAEQTMSSLLPEAKQLFTDTANSVFQAINYSDIARIAKAAVRRLESAWQADVIQTLHTIGEIQNAPPCMIRWVMANPVLREMYHDQQLAGYDEQYIDHFPDVIGEDHYDYRAAVNGVFRPTGNEDEEKAVEWLAEFQEHDVLDLSDQVCILDTWDHAIRLVNEGLEDPTSRNNAML